MKRLEPATNTQTGVEHVTGATEDAPFLAYRYRMELPDYLEYARVYAATSTEGRNQRAMMIFGIVASIVAVIAIALGRGEFWSFLILLVGLYHSFAYLSFPFRSRRQFRKIESTLGDTFIAIGNEFLAIESGPMYARCHWSYVTKAIDAPQGVLLYGERESPAAWIPQRAFPDAG